MDETAPRRNNPWPFLAIALLIVLLSVFLYVRWSRGDAGPAVVKPPPAVVPPAPPKGSLPQPPVPPPEPPPDLRLEEFRKLLEAARKAVQEKRWDDALKAVESARAIQDDPAALRPLQEEAAKGRRDEEAAARREFEAAFAELKERIEKIKLDSLYDAALGELEKFEKDHPRAAADEPFRRLRRDMADLRKDADTAYLKAMGEARRAFEEGRYPPALSLAERAAMLYPERREEVKKFQAQVNQKMLLEKMVRIPEADYWIGSDDDRYPDEKPFRKVRPAAFYIDKYEVTHEEYYAFTLATGHPPIMPPVWTREGKPVKGREKHPVVMVTWEDASRYAAWAGKRLPTAEEWEAAARGPGPQPYVFPWGNSFAEKENAFLCNCYEYWQSSRTNMIATTLPVDQAPNAPSPFGVYGMGGNVWEWTATAVKKKVGDREIDFRILKGGSFTTYQRAIRASNIYAEDPALHHPDVGFRCVRDAQ